MLPLFSHLGTHKSAALIVCLCLCCMMLLQVLAALPLILQHSEDSGHLLNSLLMASKSCREAVQRSGAQYVIKHEASHHRSCSFAAWLAHHAGLLDELTVDCSQLMPDCWGAENTFGQLLGQALQLYSMSQSNPGAAAGTTLQPSTAVHTQVQPTAAAAALRLSTLSLVGVAFTSILQAVQPAADSLTSLCLKGRLQHFTGGALAALRSLRGLQELVKSCDSPEQLPLQLYGATSKMSHLTSLFIDSVQVSGGALLQLPCSLQALKLYGPRGTLPLGSVPGKLSLQHLVKLKDLAWCWPKQDTAMQLVLPQQVTFVMLAGSVHAELPPGLLYASIINPETCMPVVEQLTALRSLQGILFGCPFEDWTGGSLNRQHAQQFAPVLGSLCSTQLSYLQIECHCSWSSYWSSDVGFGTSLQKLPALRHLQVLHARPSEADAELLTSLTNLTYLGLTHAEYGVTSALVLKLACALTGLVFLDVSGCSLRCPVVLPVLGTLTRLKQLYLHGNALVLNDARLLLLTGLRQLTALSIPNNHKVSEEGFSSFLALMPCLAKVDVDEEELVYEEDESD